MNILYFLICLLVLLYVVFKKRGFDFFTVSVVSTMAYYYPAFFGQLYSQKENAFYPIVGEVYACLFSHIITLFFFMLFYDTIEKTRLTSIENEKCVPSSKQNTFTNISVFLLSLMGVFLMIVTYVQYGGINGANKTDLLANANKFTEYYKYISLFVFVYSFSFSIEERYIKILRVIAIILVGYTFILGHRSFIVIGLIAVFSNKFMKSMQRIQVWALIKRYRVLVVCGIVVAFFFLFVKNIIPPLFNGDYELVVFRLTNPEYYKITFFNSESNAILFNLQRVCKSDFNYPMVDYIGSVFALIPVLGGVICSALDITFFEKLLNLKFNEQLSQGIGLGSTYLGEAYATGWLVFLILVLLFTFIFIAFIQKSRRYVYSRATYVWLSVILSYFSFYIHRNSLIYLFITARAFLYIVLIVYLINVVVRSLRKYRV